jgi:hypothetical protein
MIGLNNLMLSPYRHEAESERVPLRSQYKISVNNNITSHHRYKIAFLKMSK